MASSAKSIQVEPLQVAAGGPAIPHPSELPFTLFARCIPHGDGWLRVFPTPFGAARLFELVDTYGVKHLRVTRGGELQGTFHVAGYREPGQQQWFDLEPVDVEV